MSVKISVIVHTACRDDFLLNHGISSAAAMVCAELDRQPFRDFELVYVDRWYDGHPWLFDRVQHSFPIKHVPVHPNHRYWYDKGSCFISAAKNTGILHATGELIVSVDDGAVFNTNDFLQRYWDWYKKGKLLHAGYCRWSSITVVDGLPTYPLHGAQYLNDSRNFSGHVHEHERGNWLFTGCSFPLESALSINGFNERMDGRKGLEDCDFGIRLQKLGHSFVMDRSVYLHILDHDNTIKKKGYTGEGPGMNESPYETLDTVGSKVAIENYGVLEWAEQLNQTVANNHTITPEHMWVVRAATLKYRGFDPLEVTNKDYLEEWAATPTFDLRKERQRCEMK